MERIEIEKDPEMKEAMTKLDELNVTQQEVQNMLFQLGTQRQHFSRVLFSKLPKNVNPMTVKIQNGVLEYDILPEKECCKEAEAPVGPSKEPA